VNGLNLKDSTIETKLRFTDDVGYRAGIVFRYMGRDTYYELEVSNEYDCLGFSKYLPECPDYGTQNYGVLNNNYTLNYTISVCWHECDLTWEIWCKPSGYLA
jgi:hypothetical protein